MNDGSHWFTLDSELLTDAEREKRIPIPSDALIILHGGRRWHVFAEMLRETTKPVADAFKGTPLEYRTEPYCQAMPETDQLISSQYLFRQLQKLGSPEQVMGLMGTSSIDSHANTNEFPHHYFCMELHTGGNFLGVEVKQKKLIGEATGRTRTRVVPLFDRYDISFSVGFNFEGKWFYKVELLDEIRMDTYHELTKQLTRQVEVVRMMGRREITDPAYQTVFTLLQ